MFRTGLATRAFLPSHRLVRPALALAVNVNLYSTEDVSPIVHKFRAIIREYRVHNFPQELPSRVFKQVLKATDENGDGLISIEEVQNLLRRIGASEKLSKDEIEAVMKEMGAENGVGVPVERVKEFFLPKDKFS